MKEPLSMRIGLFLVYPARLLGNVTGGNRLFQEGLLSNSSILILDFIWDKYTNIIT
jgi:hypothetical protein